jgi:ubiquinol-cytochrome c reductase cytochrome c1 subunit
MDKLKALARLVIVAAVLAAGQGHASTGAKLEKAHIDPGNISSLQRGAANFMNYCSGCHSAQYVRFNTIGKYLGLSEEDLVENLMFNAEKTFETIQASMPAKDAARWYGTAPPDMSLMARAKGADYIYKMARAKGADYIYNFLKGFYLDPDSPTGVDNTILEGTSMPHVLWELQGYQKALYSEHVETHEDGSTTTTHEFEKFELVTTGTLDIEEYASLEPGC